MKTKSNFLQEMPKNTSTLDFFLWLKKESEQFWKTIELNESLYGFQIQPKTIWKKGLSDIEIDKFEKECSKIETGTEDLLKFPEVYRFFLKTMNGTQPESINIYGNSNIDPEFSPGYYSFPSDLKSITEKISWIFEENGVNPHLMRTENIPFIIPLIGHRFLTIPRKSSTSRLSQNYPILSMYGNDIILYAKDLPTFLINDIFSNHQPEDNVSTYLEDLDIEFWLK